jgi:hypothetical protein
MDAQHFYINKFEKHNPELVKLIEEWYEQSIESNWEELRIIVNEYNIPNCPQGNQWDDVKKINRTFAFIQKTCNDISDYLMAKGFTRVEVWGSQHEFSKKAGAWLQGTCIRASMYKPEKTK